MERGRIATRQLNLERTLVQLGVNHIQLFSKESPDFNKIEAYRDLSRSVLALLQTDKDNDLVSDLNEIQKAAQRSADITKQLLAFAGKQSISPRQMDLNDTVESMLNMMRRLIGEDIDLVWKPSAHLWPVEISSGST